MEDSQLERIRGIVVKYVDRHQYQSALFWADKAASLSGFHAADVYRLTQCMYLMGQYERAALLITKKKLHLSQYAFRYLAAKCYASSKAWQVALDLLDLQPQDGTGVMAQPMSISSEKIDGIPEDKEMVASIHLLKGDIYEAMDIREIAADCYKDALKADVFCYEAFEHLIGHHMLRADEEQDLINSLPFHKQCKTSDDQKLVEFLYNIKLKKYNKPGQFIIPSSMKEFEENLDVATCLAERHYYNCDFQTSYAISQKILKLDPYHSSCLTVHVALLVELCEPNKLFYLAHRLVGSYPDMPISWYAVGCYYLLQRKQDLSRRYLLKTTLLDKMYGPAWLAYGHSFAAENEHDQAMAAYFTASQLMKGCHLPFLYIGLEYSVTNNTKLAEKFFSTALDICPDDPHVLHEMGVASYTNNNFQKALKYFTSSLEQVQQLGDEVMIEEWEPLLNNLGHVHRKIGNYSQSLEFHKQALMLVPHSADTYTAIGYVLSFMGNYMEAIECLHKSLGLRRDDAFTASLLDAVVDQFAANDTAFYASGDDNTLSSHYKQEESLMEFSNDNMKGRFLRLQQQSLVQPTFSDGSGDSTTTPSPGTHRAFDLSSSNKTEQSVTPDGVQSFERIPPPNLSTPLSGVGELEDPVSPRQAALSAIETSLESHRMAWLEDVDDACSRSPVGTSRDVAGPASQRRSFRGDLALSTTDDMELDDSLDT